MKNQTERAGAGGTPGGMGEFLIGLVMAVAGGYLLTNQVTVTGGWGTLWGYSSFGLSLLPFLLGVALLFFNGRSILGWLLLVAGLTIILAGILMNMHIYFQPTSLFNTLIMLVLLAGGVGLVARSLRDHGSVPS
jgi:predicted membrane channel-forming protein YqfA (hemolysin III family)